MFAQRPQCIPNLARMHLNPETYGIHGIYLNTGIRDLATSVDSNRPAFRQRHKQILDKHITEVNWSLTSALNTTLYFSKVDPGHCACLRPVNKSNLLPPWTKTALTYPILDISDVKQSVMLRIFRPPASMYTQVFVRSPSK